MLVLNGNSLVWDLFPNMNNVYVWNVIINQSVKKAYCSFCDILYGCSAVWSTIQHLMAFLKRQF